MEGRNYYPTEIRGGRWVILRETVSDHGKLLRCVEEAPGVTYTQVEAEQISKQLNDEAVKCGDHICLIWDESEDPGMEQAA
jgi:hypothetical protein